MSVFGILAGVLWGLLIVAQIYSYISYGYMHYDGSVVEHILIPLSYFLFISSLIFGGTGITLLAMGMWALYSTITLAIYEYETENLSDYVLELLP